MLGVVVTGGAGLPSRVRIMGSTRAGVRGVLYGAARGVQLRGFTSGLPGDALAFAEGNQIAAEGEMMRMAKSWPGHEIAARYAPLLVIEPHDPPGDPLAYFSHCRLAWWSSARGSVSVADNVKRLLRRWSVPDLSVPIRGSQLTRPFEESALRGAVPLDQGFCMEPDPRPPKYLSAESHAAAAHDEFGRRKVETPRVARIIVRGDWVRSGRRRHIRRC